MAEASLRVMTLSTHAAPVIRVIESPLMCVDIGADDIAGGQSDDFIWPSVRVIGE